MDRRAGDVTGNLIAPDGRTDAEATLDAIVDRARSWSPHQVVSATLELCRTSTGSDLAVLFRLLGDRIQCLGCQPRHLDHPLAADQSAEWFPWDLGTVRTQRYVFVPDAAHLRATPTTTLGDLGFRSALHMPLRGPDGVSGALHLLWHQPQTGWDDAWGAQLRTLGAYVLFQVG